jgi:hypothetical protein
MRDSNNFALMPFWITWSRGQTFASGRESRGCLCGEQFACQHCRSIFADMAILRYPETMLIAAFAAFGQLSRVGSNL